MPWLAFIPMILSAFGSFKSGQSAAAAGKLQEQQYEAQANAESATGQREGIERQRQSDILASRALAISAASGGGAIDPTVVNIIAGINAQGNYGARSAIYGGETAAQGARFKGALSVYEGASAKQVGMIGGLGKGVSAYGAFDKPPSMYDKYA